MNFTQQLLRSIKGRICLILAVIILILAFLLTLPIITHILPHPDEHQFFFNAFNILLGKPLNNYTHVALTEYLLAVFLLLSKVFTYPGVDFPVKELSNTIFNYGRVLGLIFYFSTFFLGSLILMKGQFKVQPRHVFWSVLYFGSVGIFERFLRVNSEATAALVTLNYFFLSFVFVERRLTPFKFFWLDLFFVFLVSFSNLKYLFLILPILAVNIIFAVWAKDSDRNFQSEIIVKIYKTFVYFVGLVFGSLVLWGLLIPKPLLLEQLWVDLTTAIQSNTLFDFNYPSQAYKSWLFYPYDLIFEYFGLTQFVAFLALLVWAVLISRREALSQLAKVFKSKIALRGFFEGNIYRRTELLIVLSFLFYYFELGRNLVHWSRWTLPLALWTILLVSLLLEKAFLVLQKRINRFWLFLFLVMFFAFGWSLRVLLFVDVKSSNYPGGSGYNSISKDVKSYLEGEGLAEKEWGEKAVWFGGLGGGLRNVSLDQLVEKGNENVTYVLWPYWNIGVLYSDKMVDKTVHNQRAFVDKYAQSVIYRFPNYLSRYMHEAKYFAWKYLNLTWNPEIDSLVEAQYAVVKLREPLKEISLVYEVPVRQVSNCSYILWSACKPNPAPRHSFDLTESAGEKSLYDHSLWFRYLFKGKYEVKLVGPWGVGLEPTRVYSTNEFDWNAKEKVMKFLVDQSTISSEVGFSSQKSVEPGWRFVVGYSLERKL